MKQKEKKPMTKNTEPQKSQEKEKQDLKTQLADLGEKSQKFFNKYLLLVAMATSSLTVIAAILIAQSYINPVRDENIYIEGESQISFKQIDQEKLDTLRDSLDSSRVNVETDFVPNRNNPFSE